MAGSGDSFDFGDAFGPERPRDRDPVSDPAPPASGHVSVRRTSPDPTTFTRTRRGQSLSWGALVLAVTSAAVVGGGLFFALDSIHLRAGDTFGHARGWMLVVAVAVCGAILAFALAILAVVIARPRRVATSALVLAFALPLMSAVLGLYLGVTSLFDELIDKTGDIRDQALLALTESVEKDGLSMETVAKLLQLILSGE